MIGCFGSPDLYFCHEYQSTEGLRGGRVENSNYAMTKSVFFSSLGSRVLILEVNFKKVPAKKHLHDHFEVILCCLPKISWVKVSNTFSLVKLFESQEPIKCLFTSLLWGSIKIQEKKSREFIYVSIDTHKPRKSKKEKKIFQNRIFLLRLSYINIRLNFSFRR